MKWLELLKAGIWKDRHGKTVTITRDMISKLASNYDSSKRAAHILVGHPDKPTVPSFGIVDAVKTAGDVLLFRPGKVVAEFAALVGKGAFPGVSLGMDAAMENIDHVAFLSAERPAIDGLKPVLEFSAPADLSTVLSIDVTSSFDAVQFSAAENWYKWRINDIGALLRGLKNMLIEKFGQDAADKAINEYELNGLTGQPPAEVVEQPQFSSSKGGTMEFEKLYNELKAAVDGILAKFQKPALTEFSSHVDGIVAENDTLKKEVATLKGKVTEHETAARKVEFSAFAEKLIDERRMLPDQKATIVSMLETMHKATPVEFSSANGEKSPLDLYKAELAARPVIAPATGASTERGSEFSACSTSPVDIGLKARQYQDEMAAKGVKVDSIAAVEHVKTNG